MVMLIKGPPYNNVYNSWKCVKIGDGYHFNNFYLLIYKIF